MAYSSCSHTDQNQAGSAFIEEGADLLQTCHVKPVGLVDQR